MQLLLILIVKLEGAPKSQANLRCPKQRRILPPRARREQQRRGLASQASLDDTLFHVPKSKQRVMDAAFTPSEVVVKHFIHHQFTFELGPSVLALGKPIRNFLIGAAVLYCLKDLVRGTLQAVLKHRDTK